MIEGEANTAPGNRRRRSAKATQHNLIVGVNGVQHTLPMTDLSAAGAFVETNLPLKPGQRLQLVLQHHAYAGLSDGRIMWGNSRGFGITFVNADHGFSQTVDILLSQRMPSPDDDSS